MIYFDNLLQFDRLKHFITTKKEFSVYPFDLGLKNKQQHTVINRMLLFDKMSINKNKIVFPEQIHSDGIYDIKPTDGGKGALEYHTAIKATDALVSAIRGIWVGIVAADCVPILLYDSKNEVIAAVHSGWRGTVKQILIKTIDFLRKQYTSDPRHIFVGIGPSIGPCCYEVGEDVVSQAMASFGTDKNFLIYKKTKSKFHFDLWEANYTMLVSVGVPEKNIEIKKICTSCNNELFFSARKGDNGRFVVAAGLK